MNKDVNMRVFKNPGHRVRHELRGLVWVRKVTRRRQRLSEKKFIHEQFQREKTKFNKSNDKSNNNKRQYEFAFLGSSVCSFIYLLFIFQGLSST